VNQSRAARAALLMQWIEDDADWHTADLLREVKVLLSDIFSPSDLAAGALENAALMHRELPQETLAAVTSIQKRTRGRAAVLSQLPSKEGNTSALADLGARVQNALAGDAVLTEAAVPAGTGDGYPIAVIRPRAGGKVTELQAEVQRQLAATEDGCVVVSDGKHAATCARHGGRWPHKGA